MQQKPEHEPLLTETDPVCGTEVDPRSAVSARFEEEEYFFCSTSCRDRFLLEPGRYCVSCVELA